MNSKDPHNRRLPTRFRFYGVLLCGCITALLLSFSPLADNLNRYLYHVLMQTSGFKELNGRAAIGGNGDDSLDSPNGSISWRKYQARIFDSGNNADLNVVALDMNLNFPHRRKDPGSNASPIQAPERSRAMNTAVYIGFAPGKNDQTKQCRFLFFPDANIWLDLQPESNGKTCKPAFMWHHSRTNVADGVVFSPTALNYTLAIPIKPRLLYHGACHIMKAVFPCVSVCERQWIAIHEKLPTAFQARLAATGIAFAKPETIDWASIKPPRVDDANWSSPQTPPSETHPMLTFYHMRAVPNWLVVLGGIGLGLFAGLLFLMLSPYLAIVMVAMLFLSGCFLTFISLHSFWCFPLAEFTFFLILPALFSGSYLYGSEHRRFIILQRFFKSYVNADVMQTILDDPGMVPFKGHKVKATFMFTDIRNFTMISEKLEPQEILAGLNRYFAAMTKVVIETDGYLCRYLGDGIFAAFGASDKMTDHGAYAAVCCGLEMLKQLEELNQDKLFPGCDQVNIGIGIHTGVTVAGNVGCDARMEYTFYGDTVNLASRIEDETKIHQAPLLISETTHALVRDKIDCRFVALTKVKGRQQDIGLYTVSDS